MAALCEPSENEAELMGALFTAIGPLLPCSICSNDYPNILKMVIRRRQQSPKQACLRGEAVEFMYEIHNGVNRKLAGQRWDKFINAFSLSPELSKQLQRQRDVALTILFENPSIDIVRRRSGLSGVVDMKGGSPYCVESLWLVLLLISRRVDSSTQPLFLTLLKAAAYFTKKCSGAESRAASSSLDVCFRSAFRMGATIEKGQLFPLVRRQYFGFAPTAAQCSVLDFQLDNALSKPCTTCHI
jgi:hypothetical protein